MFFSNECTVFLVQNITEYGKAAEAECSTACPSYTQQICGGTSRNSVYQIMGKIYCTCLFKYRDKRQNHTS